MSRFGLGVVALVISLISVAAVASTDVMDFFFEDSGHSEGEAADALLQEIELAAESVSNRTPTPAVDENDAKRGEEDSSQSSRVTQVTPDTMIKAQKLLFVPSGEPVLLLSASSDRSEPLVLEGSTVSGLIYVFLAGSDIEQVDFWIDDADRSEPPYQTEKRPPFDLAGGGVGAAKPVDTAYLTDGRHHITAKVTKADGESTLVTAGFYVVSPALTSSFTTTTDQPTTTATESTSTSTTVKETVSDPKPTTTTTRPKATTTTTRPKATTTTTKPKATTTTTKPKATSTTTKPKATTTTTGGGSVQVDVVIRSGDDVNRILDSHPEGTSFLLKAGKYRRLTLVPKSGQTIIGENGTVLDGENKTSHAIGDETGANNITLRNLKIVNYTAYGVAWGAKGAGKNWVIENSEIAHNHAGVEMKDGGVLRNNHIHHNTTHGVWGNATLVLEGNEISYNHSQYHPGRAGGGVLLGRQTDSVIRNNHIHHNYSFGLHLDGHNKNVLIEDNLVEDNEGAGIFYELGFKAMIRDNVSLRNGSSGSAGDGAGILIVGSTDVTVRGNTVKDNVNGIVGRQPNRTKSDGSLWELKNLLVVDNTVKMTQGWTGIYDRASGNPSLTANNVFKNNTYINPGTNFRWDVGLINLSQWQKIHPNDG